jgi:hypothetical protein
MGNGDGVPAWLAALDDDGRQFLKRFLLASGSLKAVAEEYGISYPTVRSRLDRLIAVARAADDARDADPFERKVRALVADQKVSPAVARQLLDAHRTALQTREKS